MKTGLLALALVGVLIIVTRRAPTAANLPPAASPVPAAAAAARDLTAPRLSCWFSGGRDKHYANGIWDGTYYLNTNGEHGVVFLSGSSAVVSYCGRNFWIDNYNIATRTLPDGAGKPTTFLYGRFIANGMRIYNGVSIPVWEFSP